MKEASFFMISINSSYALEFFCPGPSNNLHYYFLPFSHMFSISPFYWHFNISIQYDKFLSLKNSSLKSKSPLTSTYFFLLQRCSCWKTSLAFYMLAFYNFFLFFFFLRVTPVAYGDSQARGWIGAVATSHSHSHSNAISELSLQPTPKLTATPDPQPIEWSQGSNLCPYGC